MASWQSPGLGPARLLTVTLAPRAQLGARPGLGGGESQALAWGGRGWKQQNGPWPAGWLAGQLLTWETCPTSLGQQGLNALPWAPTTPPTATGKLLGTTAPSARLGWVSAPFSVWGQHSPRSQGVSLSLGQALAGRLTAHTGWLPTATTASWIASSGFATAPSLPGPTSHQEQGRYVCAPLCPQLFMPWGQGAGRCCLSFPDTPSQTFICFLPLSLPPHVVV